ncbi:50S ribosomal protein L25 [bacterium]|nr:50S ribosomal protein L25 [bacterium]
MNKTQAKISLLAQKRDKKEKPKNIRQKGLIPAVIYGPQTKPISLFVKAKEAEKAVEVGTSHLIDLEINGTKKKVLIYDIQFDPITDKIIHLDFYAVRMDQPIKTEIPLDFKGKPPAVKNKGGVLLTEKDSVEVECLPKDLVDEIKVDLTVLKDLHDTIKVGDLKTPKGIEITEDKEVVIATIQPPRSEEELAELEEAPVEDVEAVEVEKGKEEEEEEEKAEETKEEEEQKEPQPEEKTS